jgi:CDP-glucose 4,6-dehydratase
VRAVEGLGVTGACPDVPAPLPVGRLPDPQFWRGKRVFLTGHTGFKGAWATQWLSLLGAEVTGLALAPDTEPALFSAARMEGLCRSHLIDLKDRAAVAALVDRSEPEIVLHMAAQPLVRRSYREPVETFQTNMMGTVHLLDAIRLASVAPKAVLIVTSDKVYANDNAGRAFAEGDRLGGHDPYAASKAATEIVAASYRDAFLAERGIRLATVRGGNVIGGGDFSQDRIVPDLYRAAIRGETLLLRSPRAVRPWQHVLDCLSGYLAFAEDLALKPSPPEALNIGPDPGEPIPVGMLASTIQAAVGVGNAWQRDDAHGPKEMTMLSLDPSAAHARLGWTDRLPGRAGLLWTARWYADFAHGGHARELVLRDIEGYETGGGGSS